jgi:type IV secretion system protein VirD4
MKHARILDRLNILFSRLASLQGQGGQLHHARFALAHELQSLVSHRLDEEALLLSATHLGGIYRVRKTPARRELGNLLVCAPPRSGKSILAMSQLLTWPHSVLIVDIKGELYLNTAGYRSTLGPVFVIDPEGVGHQYDPLHGLTREGALYEVAKNLLFDPKEADGRSFTEWGILMEVLKWQACLELNRKTGAKYRLLPFTRALSKLGINPAANALSAISPHIAQELLDGAYDPKENYKDNKYFANSWQASRARMFPLLTDEVVRCFNGSDFTGADIIAGEKPVSVYLRIPEGSLEAKAPLIRLVLESLTTEMFATFDNPQGRTCRPVLVLLDEAGVVGFAKLPHYSATCAGRGISFWVALQDLSQLEGLYQTHKARTIRNNMGAKVFFRPEDYATAKSISDTLGYTSGYSRSETLREGEVSSEGRAEQAVRVLTERELMELGDRETIFFYKNLKPGRGLRMEYWRFPLLEKRRSIPPPPITELPPVPEMVFPYTPSETSPAFSGERRTGYPRFPIDPEDFN